MRITITENCNVSTDGINVLVLKAGDTPILPDDLCDIIMNQMRAGKPYKKEEELKISPIDKSMGAAPQNKSEEPEPKKPEEPEKPELKNKGNEESLEIEPEEGKPDVPVPPSEPMIEAKDLEKLKDKMRVSAFSHIFKYTSSEVITAAMNLNISATHPRSSLSKEEAERMLIYLRTNANN